MSTADKHRESKARRSVVSDAAKLIVDHLADFGYIGTALENGRVAGHVSDVGEEAEIQLGERLEEISRENAREMQADCEGHRY